jgi:hypothetical protein
MFIGRLYAEGATGMAKLLGQISKHWYEPRPPLNHAAICLKLSDDGQDGLTTGVRTYDWNEHQLRLWQ